ncbi:MAG: nucleotidyl transferase AbiEii/AbiGii toxin family protein [Thermodesulfobacteriota bacterium]|nr:nucleotidyl transferase AbiEii/AbiGii toxin family protein [Thermodesulfobacteriota bacterium]
MNIFEKHEIFEIEVLEKLKNERLLEPLVFGGGSMLRLCHELKRYSVDLDFWRIKSVPVYALFDKFQHFLKQEYYVTKREYKKLSAVLKVRSMKVRLKKCLRQQYLETEVLLSMLKRIL